MYLDLKEFTSAINKISDIVSGDKIVPGVLLRLNKGDEPDVGLLSVCYSDGHKAVIEELKVNLEDSDFIGDVATPYEQLNNALSSCQPRGKIKVDQIRIEYFPETLKLSTEQFVEYQDESGENTLRSKMGTKYIDIARFNPADSVKTKMLVRQKYEDIFTGEQLDEYDKSELSDLLVRTSTEKGKLIYFSSIKQEVLVANQAHAVACKVSGYPLGEDEKQYIKQELEANGITSEEDFEKVCKEKTDRMHHSFVVFQQMAKAISSILNRITSDVVYIERVEGFCNIFVDNDNEKVGIWFEIPKGSKVHLNYVESFSSLGYKTYQMTFLKDLIYDAISQALNTTKTDSVALKFESELSTETGKPVYYMVVNGGSASASTSNMNRFVADDMVDSVGDITSRTFTVSLKVLLDMISQVKTDLLALDMDVEENSSVKIRVAEIDMQKQMAEYSKIREGLDGDTPTPVDAKLNARERVLGFRQFTMLSK